MMSEQEQTEEEKVDFTLVRYNPRRAARGAEAAEVKVDFGDGDTDLLWMSESDLIKNIKEYGPCPGLVMALDAYKKNQAYP